MTCTKIGAGLRRLEFTQRKRLGTAAGVTHVLVEFARNERLARDQHVQIHLGVRAGSARLLEGVPTLLGASDPIRQDNYLYRLEGDVS